MDELRYSWTHSISSRCGSRTGGQSFVKVRGVPRSPGTRLWRRHHIGAKWNRMKTNRTSPYHRQTPTSLLLLLLAVLLRWIKVGIFAPLSPPVRTSIFPGAPFDFPLLHFSPSWQRRSVTAMHLTSLLWGCCPLSSPSPRCFGPSYSSTALPRGFHRRPLLKTVASPFRLLAQVKLCLTLTWGCNCEPNRPDTNILPAPCGLKCSWSWPVWERTG